MLKFVMHNCLWLGVVHVHSSPLVLLVVCFAVMRGVQIRRGEGGKRGGRGGAFFGAIFFRRAALAAHVCVRTRCRHVHFPRIRE